MKVDSIGIRVADWDITVGVEDGIAELRDVVMG